LINALLEFESFNFSISLYHSSILSHSRVSRSSLQEV